MQHSHVLLKRLMLCHGAAAKSPKIKMLKSKHFSFCDHLAKIKYLSHSILGGKCLIIILLSAPVAVECRLLFMGRLMMISKEVSVHELES